MQERILVADPVQDFLDQTRYLLERKGYQFLQASNGEDAKLKLEHDQIDLFLVNFQLPLIDGPSLCQFIRKDLNRPVATALMVGQDAPHLSIDQQATTDTILRRPLQPSSLFNCIQSLQTIRRLLVQNTELRRRLGDPKASSYVAPPPQQLPPPSEAPVIIQNDPKQALYPMPWFRKLADLEVKRAIRFRQSLSLLLVAYDQSEEFSKIYSDEQITFLSDSLGQAVPKVIRSIDIPVQFPPQNHILILLPNTGIEGAIRGATRIQQALYEYFATTPVAQYGPPALSIGTTTSPTQGDFRFTDLLRDATRALREVRSQGGNGVFYC